MGTTFPTATRKGWSMSSTESNPQTREPTTEEALPGVDLTVDPATEEISRETLGPGAAEAAGQKTGASETGAARGR